MKRNNFVLKSGSLRKLISLIALTAMVLSSAAIMSGCGQTGDSQTIQMYYLTGEGNSLSSEKYKIKDAPDKDAAVEQVLNEMVDESSRAATRALFSSEVTINSAVVSADLVSIDFGKGYYSMTKVQELMARAGIVKTLTQIEGINSVRFSIEGIPITNSKGEEIGDMTADTFVDNSGLNQPAQQENVQDSDEEAAE